MARSCTAYRKQNAVTHTLVVGDRIFLLTGDVIQKPSLADLAKRKGGPCVVRTGPPREESHRNRNLYVLIVSQILKCVKSYNNFYVKI